MSIVEGHILKIIHITQCKNKTDFCVILSVINNNNKFTIKGFIDKRPIEDNFIKASNFKEIKDSYGSLTYDSKNIIIGLPKDNQFIINKIKKYHNNKLTTKEIENLLSLNPTFWDSLSNKNLNYGKIKADKIEILYKSYIEEFPINKDKDKDEKYKFKDFLVSNNIILKENQIDNLLKKYTKSINIIDKMNNNLIEFIDIDGFGIQTIRNIANSLNFPIEEKIKIEIIYVLVKNSNGDTCIKYNKLVNYLIEQKYSIGIINHCIEFLLDNNYIVNYNDFIYEKKMFQYEQNIGFKLSSINDEPVIGFLLHNAIDFLDNYEGSKLNNEQTDSFLSIFKYNVNITTGPAGTGKSEILTRLSKFFHKRSECHILFLTPTGKACDRLTKGFKKKGNNNIAYTIHKFNYFDYDKQMEREKNDAILLNDGTFLIDSANKQCEDIFNIYENNYKIFVIDEMSMVGLKDFNDFILKINLLKNSVLLLLGDTNQLPSVSSGNVLHELVHSNVFNHVQLKDIFRSDSIGLLTAQNNILNFISPIKDIPDNDTNFIWKMINPNDKDSVIQIFKDLPQLPLVITSTNKVVDYYQDIIKDNYNLPPKDTPFFEFYKQKYYIEDVIIITANDYDNGLMNGMIGTIKNIIIKDNNKDNHTVNHTINDKKNNTTYVDILFDGDTHTKQFELSVLINIKLAYIITIHKSQGSESDVVIVILTKSNINTINLLYTAITRAKKICYLISDSDTIRDIIHNKRFINRISNLKDFCS